MILPSKTFSLTTCSIEGHIEEIHELFKGISEMQPGAEPDAFHRAVTEIEGLYGEIEDAIAEERSFATHAILAQRKRLFPAEAA